MKVLLRLSILVFWTAGPALASEAQVGLLTNAASVAKCKRLTQVSASPIPGEMMTNASYGSALTMMKTQAAKAGATHVVLLNASAGFAGGAMLGTAYRCPRKAPVRPPRRPPSKRVTSS